MSTILFVDGGLSATHDLGSSTFVLNQEQVNGGVVNGDLDFWIAIRRSIC